MSKGIRLWIDIEGNKRFVSAEVALKMIADALRDVTFESGRTEIYQDSDARIYINGQLVYEPKVKYKIG